MADLSLESSWAEGGISPLHISALDTSPSRQLQPHRKAAGAQVRADRAPGTGQRGHRQKALGSALSAAPQRPQQGPAEMWPGWTPPGPSGAPCSLLQSVCVAQGWAQTAANHSCGSWAWPGDCAVSTHLCDTLWPPTALPGMQPGPQPPAGLWQDAGRKTAASGGCWQGGSSGDDTVWLIGTQPL